MRLSLLKKMKKEKRKEQKIRSTSGCKAKASSSKFERELKRLECLS